MLSRPARSVHTHITSTLTYTPGGVSERSKETVLKTVGRFASRGFESHPLRGSVYL